MKARDPGFVNRSSFALGEMPRATGDWRVVLFFCMLPVYLLKGLELSPVALLRIVQAVSPDAYDRKTAPDRFTFRESIAHVADWAQVDMDRLKAGLAEPGCTVMGIDEGQRAIDLDYASWDPVESAKKVVERRRELLAIVDGLSEEQLAIAFNHSERGRVTVVAHLTTILGHEMYHVEHLAQYLG